jgi:uncharacterized membrane protein
VTRRQLQRKHAPSAHARKQTREERERYVRQRAARMAARAIAGQEWVDRERRRERRRRAVDGLLGPVRRAPGPTALLAFAVLGVGVSAYLTTVHYAGIPLVCSTTGVVDCAAVTSSAYSVIPGTAVPITVLGVGWFLGSGALAVASLIAAMTGRQEPRWLRRSHALLGVTGLIAVLYLVFVEAVRLHRLCEWCTAVHLLVFGTLLVTLARLQHAPPSGDQR